MEASAADRRDDSLAGTFLPSLRSVTPEAPRPASSHGREARASMTQFQSVKSAQLQMLNTKFSLAWDDPVFSI